MIWDEDTDLNSNTDEFEYDESIVIEDDYTNDLNEEE